MGSRLHHSRSLSVTISSVNRRVLNDYNPLVCIIEQPELYELFLKFCSLEHSEENILFYKACHEFPSNPLRQIAQQIYDTYISPGNETTLFYQNPMQVGLDTDIIENIKYELKKDNCNILRDSLFDDAKGEIFVMLKGDTFRRFTQTDTFISFIKTQGEETPDIWKKYMHLHRSTKIPSNQITKKRNRFFCFMCS